LLPQQFESAYCSWKGFMKLAFKMASCGIYILCFMKISTSVQVILRFCLGCHDVHA
jgi:hypothetical protein